MYDYTNTLYTIMYDAVLHISMTRNELPTWQIFLGAVSQFVSCINPAVYTPLFSPSPAQGRFWPGYKSTSLLPCFSPWGEACFDRLKTACEISVYLQPKDADILGIMRPSNSLLISR